MENFIEKSGISLVSLIIPQARMHYCMAQVLEQWPYEAIQFDCRGTMTREHWFQKFLPIMNPECEYLQFLVSDEDLSEFVQFCIKVNDLHLPGAGAIFTTRCLNYSTNAAEKCLKREDDSKHGPEHSYSPVRLKNNLYGIFALIQSGRTDSAIKAAMQAGSHGPIVYFVEGRGTRDRVGWLKITKKPYEEVVMVLVEDIDRARVKDALVSAGRVNSLGGGIVFEIPMEYGLANLPTSIINKSRLASNEQIIAAVDQLMGSTDWRDTRSLESLMEKSHDSTGRNEMEVSTALCALIPRKYTEDFLEHVLSIGIPGANVIYTKLFTGEDNKNEKQLHIRHELVLIRMVLPPEKCSGYRSQLQGFCSEQEYTNASFFELEVRGVVHYRLKLKDQGKGLLYRGVSSNAGDTVA